MISTAYEPHLCDRITPSEVAFWQKIVDSSIENLKPLLRDDFQDVIDSCTSDEFLKDIKLLSSILENIPVAGDVLDSIERAVTGIADVRTHFVISRSSITTHL